MGKPIEHLQAALRAALATAPVGEHLTTIGKQLSYFFFLSYDAIVWVCPTNAAAFWSLANNDHQANAIKFVRLNPETSQKIQKKSFQFWFAGILFSIINGILKVCYPWLARPILNADIDCAIGKGGEAPADDSSLG